MSTLRRIIAELAKPSHEQSGHYRVGTWAAHGFLGMGVAVIFDLHSFFGNLIGMGEGVAMLASSLTVMVVYWLLKELGDWLLRDGDFFDGIEDTTACGFGAAYTGDPLWALLACVAMGVAMWSREAKRSR